MKKLQLSGLIARGLAAGVAIMSFGTIAKATPYATELANTGGTVSFTLNESADNVKIIFGGTTNNLGALAAGSYSTNVGASNPFSVQVSKSSAAGYKAETAPGVAGKLQISTDPLLSRFPSPRGVAVNKNPASQFFGRIYVVNSTPGTTATRPVGRGVYTMKADFSDSPNGYGNTAKTNGLGFAVSANSPYRATIGSDDYVYISDFADASSLVSRMDGNLTTGEKVLDYVGGPSTIGAPTNHGSTQKIIAEGSLAGGDLKLYTVDEDLVTGGSKNGIWRYDIGSGPLTNQSTPTLIAAPFLVGQTSVDFTRGTNGYFYAMATRSLGGGGSGLFVLDQTGVQLASSLQLWQGLTGNPTEPDIMTNLQSIAVSPDCKYLAAVMVGGPNPSDTWIIPLVNGIPDLSKRMLLDSGTVTQARGVEFDAAGNLYTLSSGDAVLRAFSPGGVAVTTTSSSGTFNMFNPSTDVSVVASAAVATEAGVIPGMFTISRNLSGTPLTVNFTLSGTASNGIDYVSIPGSVTFAANDLTTNIIVTPINDGIVEFTETVTLTVNASLGYNNVAPTIATLVIADDEIPTIEITAVHNTMYERLAADYVTYRLVRRGETNASLSVNLGYTGTAASDRYTAPAVVNIDPGVVTQNFTVTPVNDGLLQGDQTIVAGLLSGGGYSVGAISTASATIVDDDTGPETVIFADDFTSDSTLNWKVASVANDGVTDSTLVFSFDYALLGIPPAPHSTNPDTLGLYMTVNKAVAGAQAAAINLYPIGQNFTGNFAVRFDMYLLQNNSSGQTEHALFGINHSGDKTNWFRSSGNGYTNSSYDGLWFQVESDAAALGDYVLNTAPVTNVAGIWSPTAVGSRSASTLTNEFKVVPFIRPGVPSNILSSETPSWADVEVSQVGNLVTLKLNQTIIMQYTNTTAFNSGNIMLGYDDAFDSIGLTGGAVIYDNVRVISLPILAPATLTITGIQIIGGNAQIDFTSTVDEAASAYKLQAASAVTGSYADSGSVVKLSPGVYRATVPQSGTAQFYRIKQ